MATDPYAAPRARVADQPAATDEGTFVPDGQAVAAIHGWTWIVEGWRLFTRQPLMWVVLALLFGIIAFVMAVIPIVGQIGIVVLFPVFIAGLMLACRDLDQGGEIGVRHLFAGFQSQTGSLIGLGLLSLAAFMVLGLIVVGAFWSSFAAMGRAMNTGRPDDWMPMMGTLMLAGLTILALSIPIYMAFWFAPALVVLKELGPGDALRASFKACLRNIVPFLLYGVVMFALSVVAGLIYIGWLVLGPVVAGSVYVAYRDIFYAK